MSEPWHAHDYFMAPPPEPSAGLVKWLARIKQGWKPNRRLRQMAYATAADYFRVYIWEWFHVLSPALYGVPPPSWGRDPPAAFVIASGASVNDLE